VLYRKGDVVFVITAILADSLDASAADLIARVTVAESHQGSCRRPMGT
jgi:hypothetical protein